MPTDMSNILPCPNCKSKPRVIGISGGNPVKIRCSNKKCELSHESAGVSFWQGIRRDFSEDQTREAFEQFQSSIVVLSASLRKQAPVIKAAVDRYHGGPYWKTNDIESFSVELRPFILALREYMK